MLTVLFCFVASARCSVTKGMKCALETPVLELCTSAGSMSILIHKMLMAQGPLYNSHHRTKAELLQETPWSRTKATLPSLHAGNGQGEVKKRERSCMNIH